jgi:hypothetical protein
MMVGLEGRQVEGFLVPSLTAVERLEVFNPDAAAWWREHTPHLMRRGRHFVFDSAACELVDRQGA